MGAIGAVVATRNADFLAGKRWKHQQQAIERLDRIDRSLEVFNARAEFVLAAAIGAQSDTIRKLREAYLEVWHRHWGSRPEDIVLADVWDVWMTAERSARDKQVARVDRQKQITTARIRILDWLKDERMRLLK